MHPSRPTREKKKHSEITQTVRSRAIPGSVRTQVYRLCVNGCDLGVYFHLPKSSRVCLKLFHEQFLRDNPGLDVSNSHIYIPIYHVEKTTGVSVSIKKLSNTTYGSGPVSQVLMKFNEIGWNNSDVISNSLLLWPFLFYLPLSPFLFSPLLPPSSLFSSFFIRIPGTGVLEHLSTPLGTPLNTIPF